MAPSKHEIEIEHEIEYDCPFFLHPSYFFLSMSTPVVSINDLNVLRGGTVILKNLSWEVQPGENWAVLGANGSGKTTLLSCITGYVTPSSGRIGVFGKQYGKFDWRDLRKQIGLVSSSIRHLIDDDQIAVDVVASGRDAALNLWRHASGNLQHEALATLREVECLALAERPWAYLSQGERQRVLIGRALVAKHPILILDEPCAGLDPVAREKFLQFIGRLAVAKATPNLVLVTHHVEEILPCFGWALLLKEGAALAAGPISKVISSRNLTRAFGSPIEVRKSAGRYQLKFKAL
jgi:iron complex transport system ATP-binding protein